MQEEEKTTPQTENQAARSPKTDKRSTVDYCIDPTLDQYDDLILFPEKLAKANQTLKEVGLPKQWLED